MTICNMTIISENLKYDYCKMTIFWENMAICNVSNIFSFDDNRTICNFAGKYDFV